MNRREFVKYGAAGLSLPFWLQSCDFSMPSYPIKINSDHTTGHLIMESKNWKRRKGDKLDLAIVGGGIAGMTAAYQHRHLNTALFELSSHLGGTSGSESFGGIAFSQGAHYDLEYPEGYGVEVLSLLEELDIIQYQPWKKSWGFRDQQHVIPYFRRQQCYDHGALRKDVIPESPLKDQFVELMMSYSGKVNLPTSLITPEYQPLNDLTFTQFLNQHLELTPDLKRQLDYHMYDDYGGNADQVSALAGIIYFACRPYYQKSVDLFSPPNGNAYFIQKLAQHLPASQLKTRHLVSRVEKQGNVFHLEVLDTENQTCVEVQAEEVIYAGQKHALKYIYPEQADLFSNHYAPWMVVNFITDQAPKDYGFWQNEYLGENPQFLGFIDSSVQHQASLKGKRVFTGYYCLSENDREYLTTVPEVKERIAAETLTYIEKALQQKIDVEACFIKVMGHAMPIPGPGYLFKDANHSEKAQMIYTGVDNGRLPLLFEALESGISTSKRA